MGEVPAERAVVGEDLAEVVEQDARGDLGGVELEEELLLLDEVELEEELLLLDEVELEEELLLLDEVELEEEVLFLGLSTCGL